MLDATKSNHNSGEIKVASTVPDISVLSKL